QLELIHVPPLLFRERRDQVESIEVAETPDLFSGQFSARVAVRGIAMVAVLNLAEGDNVAPALVADVSDIGRIADEEGLPRTDDDVEPREIEVSSGGPLCDGSLPAVEQCDPPPSTTAARLHILPVDNQEVAPIVIAVDLERSFFGISP